MSVISRFMCAAPRVSLVQQSNVSRIFLRHFMKKARPIKADKNNSNVHEFRLQQIREEPVIKPPPVHSGAQGKPSLGKFVVYTIVAVPTFFAGCVMWQCENRKFKKPTVKPLDNPQKEYTLREELNKAWNQLRPADKMIYTLIALNLVVFGMWKVPALARTIMPRYFVCMPVKEISATTTTLSGFSHQSFFHLFCNMYVMTSFSSACLYLMKHEEMLAVFLSGITVSSLVSSMHKVASGRMIPSVGASGGVLTLIAIVCYSMPDSRISIAFVDQIIPHSFTAKTAILGVMAIDIAGLLFRWRLFDHAAHLGGTLFGLFYASYGNALIWEKLRQPIFKWWYKRNK